MEEGKIATAWAQLVRLKTINVYKNACATLGNTFLLAWGRLGSISAPFGEPAIVLLVQLNVRNMEEGKIATAWAQFGATEKVHQCI
jgi:hypothetical protein